MAYRILYDREGADKPPKGGYRRFLLTTCCFLLFLWVVCTFWPEGREILRVTLIPGDPDQTLHAAEVFAQELGSGFCVADATRNFCMAVLAHGYSG